ncbi:MAG: hypothetical protein E5W53_03120 [Mesorhizobium sp.]|nr:MAG: hypothetical protein E5W53_03120 [Mesorhizobium sp.]
MATWPVRNLPRPEYPAGIRVANPNDDRLHEARAALIDYFIDVAYKAAGESGDGPMQNVALLDLMSLHGEVLATTEWSGLRMRELESRVAAIEADATVFRGVFQRSLPYRKGSLVVCGGSLWCALRSVEEGIVPDGSTPDHWQLCVKKGDLG